MKKNEIVFFGHKSLQYTEYDSVKSLLNYFQFSLDNADIRIPCITGFSPETLHQDKIPSTTYLEWVKNDLKSKTINGYSNAISNSKKAVIRRQDEILSDILDIKIVDLCMGKQGETNNKETKARLDFLFEGLKISIPKLIKKLIIDPRNSLEHDFSIPTENHAEDAYEIANLFLDSTQKYLDNSLITSLEIGLREKENTLEMKKGISVSFRHRKFLIYFVDTKDTGNYAIIDSKHAHYISLIKHIINFSHKQDDKTAFEIKRILYQA